MAEFKVGGRVVCIDVDTRISHRKHHQIPLTKNKVYTVTDINKAPCCGILLLNIGIDSIAGKTLCWNCGQITAVTDSTWWFSASRFLPLDDFKEVTFTEIKKEVPVSAQ